ncbi:MAG: ribonuclease D [Anaerolineales bacterium]|nr:ribonuclease D [Anaerolineales bacterium]
MSSATLPPPIWVDTPASLDALTAQLARQPRLAVDTESNSLHAYRERVCLIQFSTPRQDFLLDPLAIPDLASLKAIFSDPRIEKVFHAVEYDLIGMRRDFDYAIVNIFDTMQAARILGYTRVGLDGMLAEKFDLKVDKRFQKADWGRRPLPADQLNYARLDTHYLLDLRDSLYTELVERDLWPLASEEFARLSQGNGNGKNDHPVWQRVGQANRLDERQLAILQELWNWRESLAERMDRPVFKVISEKWLIQLAKSTPGTMHGLDALGLTPRQIQLYGRSLLEAIERGRKARPVSKTRHPRPSQAYIDRLDSLSEWRKRLGREMGVDSDIILPKPFLLAIAESNPRTLTELATAMPNSPWRLEKFGNQILTTLQP